MRFTKMHGLGNDYVYINGFKETVSDPAALAIRIADRHRGVGGDGMILVLPPAPGVQAHVRMRMFNADGSESEMCGNGVRCVCKLAHDHGLSNANPMLVQTGRGVLSLAYTLDASGKVDQVTVDMGQPILEAGQIPVVHPDLPAGQKIVNHPGQALLPYASPPCPQDWPRDCRLDWAMTCVSMGNPHLVLYCGDVQMVPLELVGPYLENARIFPRRINVHFVQVVSPDRVIMRTWERGSGITQACGTGASAVCVAGVLTGRTHRLIQAQLPGGELTLHWQEADQHVHMTGPATEVFQGDWPIG